MYTSILSATMQGIRAIPVQVEVDASAWEIKFWAEQIILPVNFILWHTHQMMR